MPALGCGATAEKEWGAADRMQDSSPYLHNHNMHAFDTALPTKSVLHISCMNALCTLGRQSLSTMFVTNDAEDFFTTRVTTAICPQQKAFAMLCTDAQLETLY
ncbi:uncharacterized protein TrAtP1_003170 [Trichoderma atroviride]|uniref:uncharacterized protein n=1 Tax=Hypocrea atroviridis TaxID=63577 RepID=UPI00332512DF|nr:hypothetical protein TrAtP1_003170 [Trichoderma atroviride]